MAFLSPAIQTLATPVFIDAYTDVTTILLSQDGEQFFLLRSFPVSLHSHTSFPVPIICSHQFFCPHRFIFSRMSCKWDHRILQFFELASFS